MSKVNMPSTLTLLSQLFGGLLQHSIAAFWKRQPHSSSGLTFCHYVKHFPYAALHLLLGQEALQCVCNNSQPALAVAVSVVHFCSADCVEDDEQRRVRIGGHETAAHTNVKAPPHFSLARVPCAATAAHTVLRKRVRARVCEAVPSKLSCASYCAVPSTRVGGRVRGRPYYRHACLLLTLLLLAAVGFCCCATTLHQGEDA